MEDEEIYLNSPAERIDNLGIANLKLIQNKHYFCFGTDSVLLANFVESNRAHNEILDLCSGGGIIPIIISAKRRFDKLFAVELQEEMYDLLERNICMNHLQEVITPIWGDIKSCKQIRKRLLEKTGRDSFDIVTVNPPYKEVGTGCKNEKNVKYIARHEEKCTLDDIFSVSSQLLRTRGKLYLVHKPQRLPDLITLARKYHLEVKRIQLVYPTLKQAPSIVLLEYLKNGGNELQMMPPIIEYDEEGNETDQMAQFYGVRRGDKKSERQTTEKYE